MDWSDRTTVYIYDGTFDGFLSAVFAAWNDRPQNFGNIKPEENLTPGLLDVNMQVASDASQTGRVRKWMRDRLLEGTEQRIYEYFLSEDMEREKRIYLYLRACHRFGQNVDSRLNVAAVSDFLEAERKFHKEYHRMCQFVRFTLLEENVLFSEIGPDYNHLPHLGDFFLDRMPGQRFIIYDSERKRAVLSNGSQLVLLEDFHVDSVKAKDAAENFETLWKGYLKALTIEERRNYKLQRQMLPIKYRKYMTEFQ